MQIFTPKKYAEELEKKLYTLEGNLLFCFNNQDDDIFKTFEEFKKKIQINNINQGNIDELDTVNMLLAAFIKNNDKKCKKKEHIKSKKDLQTQLLEIRSILQKNKSTN